MLMGTWRDYVSALREKYVGRRVRYNGGIYTVANVDCNGIVHIDLPNRHNATTAVYSVSEADANMVGEDADRK